MRPGHADAQFLFEQIGRASGYDYRRTWSRKLPTDGVWFVRSDHACGSDLPIVALEVAVSEGQKAIKGSIDTLAEVSPALGLLVVNEVEIRRGLVRNGKNVEEIVRRIAALTEAAQERVTRHQQRIEVWTYAQLLRRYQLVTGDQTPVLLKRLTSTNSR